MSAVADTVTLGWDASPDAVAGYNVYFGVSGSPPLGHTDVGLATNAVVGNLLEGQTYAFYATAYDVNSVESEPSNELVYFVGPGPATVTNRIPWIASIPAQNADEGRLLQFTVNASDPDAGQTLSYTMSNAPAGSVLNISSGLFSWTPTAAQSPSAREIMIAVTDDGAPPLSANQSFQVVARAGYLLAVTGSAYGTVQVSPLGSLNAAGTKFVSGTTVTVTAKPGPGYKFSNWLLDGGSYSANPLSFQIAANRTLVPYYSRGSKILASTQ